MLREGWQRLLAEVPKTWKPGGYPIVAYSEFMPPPRVAWKPYGSCEPSPFREGDPHGWHVSEYEEIVEIEPGLAAVAGHVLTALIHLGEGRCDHRISQAKLNGNPYWPAQLAAHAGKLAHERYVTLLPLALSQTQDDKGRVRWTLLGNSEQGPERAFWKSFYTAPGVEASHDVALHFFCRLITSAYGQTIERQADLHHAGFRILPSDKAVPDKLWHNEPLPSWTNAFLWNKSEPVENVKYLLTFQPFAALPEAIRAAYLGGRLHLLPCPGRLLFWGSPALAKLNDALPMARQLSLLSLCDRHEAAHGLRTPQAGWLHEPHNNHQLPDDRHGIIRNTFVRSHRWQHVHRHDDVLSVLPEEDRVAHVLFSAEPKDVDLYNKPMARNAQIWTEQYELLLDGPRASRRDLEKAAAAVRGGGHFGYRFLYPAMRVGKHEVYWHRPLLAFRSSTGGIEVLPDAPLGYMTAYTADRPRLDSAIELWPRLADNEAERLAAGKLLMAHDHPHCVVGVNVKKCLHAWQLAGSKPLPRSFARHLLTMPKGETLDDWLAQLEHALPDAGEGRRLAGQVRDRLEPSLPPHWRPAESKLPEPLTYRHTSKRSFEETYWKTIAKLAHGEFINKDNADCVADDVSHSLRKHQHRDLEKLGDYLLDYYRKLAARHGLERKALVGDLPFTWRTDFDFSWQGGWLHNQQGKTEERDLMVVIPGKDRRRAVIMADHYDTAYMEDHFYASLGGNGARLAAAGADDNHSATAALMLGAPIFMELSKAGKLDCDVWLIHLTGEEFPSDCMGARHLAQCLVEGSLALRMPGRKPATFPGVRVQGLYVLDMIAHNRDNDRDIFQIAPGTSRESLALAWHAHMANMIWNSNAPKWNQRPARQGRGHGRRSADPAKIPETAEHLLVHGEVRPHEDPRSSIFNTDGQIFSDAGVPVVLFMENYDIHRQGYHDTHDTMENIDLDYGSAVAAITIESVARAAQAKPGELW